MFVKTIAKKSTDICYSSDNLFPHESRKLMSSQLHMRLGGILCMRVHFDCALNSLKLGILSCE